MLLLVTKMKLFSQVRHGRAELLNGLQHYFLCKHHIVRMRSKVESMTKSLKAVLLMYFGSIPALVIPQMPHSP